jgi:raffinose/stachyose/melibiose transport system permease protein
MSSVFVLPALTVYTLLFVAPAIVSVWISLYRWHGAGDTMRWGGLANYLHIVRDPLFRSSFGNSLRVLLAVGAVTFAVSFVFIMVLRELPGQSLIRAVLFFPHVVSPIVLGVAWGFILDPNNGALNVTLRALGLGGLAQVWMGPDLIFEVMMLGMAWTSIGFYTTILMAGVDRIPSSYYEECELGGANLWQKFRYVTLPLNWDVFSVAAVLWSIGAMKTFEFIYAFAGIGQLPSSDTWTSALYVYALGFSSNGPPQYGLACAMSVVMMLVVGLLVVLLRRLTRREAIQF